MTKKKQRCFDTLFTRNETIKCVKYTLIYEFNSDKDFIFYVTEYDRPGACRESGHNRVNRGVFIYVRREVYL